MSTGRVSLFRREPAASSASQPLDSAAMAWALAEPDPPRGPTKEPRRERGGLARGAALRRRIPRRAARRQVRVVHSQGDVTRDESGRAVRQFGVMQDITELRRAEGELRASEARFRTFVDHARDAFFLLDEQLTIVDVNRQACESLGWSREELIGMHPRDFDAALDEASIARLAERAAAGRNDHVRDASSTQGRHGLPGRDPHRHVPAGRRALLPGARARYQRAQARGGDRARERQ